MEIKVNINDFNEELDGRMGNDSFPMNGGVQFQYMYLEDIVELVEGDLLSR